eukprot:1633460-Lingulodinium_polyedra.AAC.1
MPVWIRPRGRPSTACSRSRTASGVPRPLAGGPPGEAAQVGRALGARHRWGRGRPRFFGAGFAARPR